MKTNLKNRKLKFEKFKIYKISTPIYKRINGGDDPNTNDTLTHNQSTKVCNIIMTND